MSPTSVSFESRTVIVTGAGNGLGRAHALELGRLGAHVIVNDIGSGPNGRSTADFVVDEIRQGGGSATPSYDSVAERGACEHIAEIALNASGRIDAVVHNAGILRNAPFPEMTDDQFWPVLETHLVGAYFLTKAVYPTMLQQSYGRLVYTSSSSGVWGRPNGANYASAKAALVGLCNAVALEGKEHGILANAIMPVALTRLGGHPEDIDSSEEAEAKRADLRATRTRRLPEWVTPVAVYLASSACDRTHRYYSAVEGRYARVFVGVSSGWRAPDTGRPPTADDVAAHLDEIEDLSSYDLPESVFEEVELVSERFSGR